MSWQEKLAHNDSVREDLCCFGRCKRRVKKQKPDGTTAFEECGGKLIPVMFSDGRGPLYEVKECLVCRKTTGKREYEYVGRRDA